MANHKNAAKLLTVETIRRKNLEHLVQNHKSLSAFSNVAGKSVSFLSRLLSTTDHKNIGSNLARELEERLGKPYGWFDHPHDDRAKSKIIDVFSIEHSITKQVTLISMSYDGTSENVFGVELDNSVATSVYPAGSVIIFSEDITILKNEDLVLIDHNGLPKLCFYYIKGQNVALLPLNTIDPPLHIGAPHIIAKALKSINPTFKPNIDANEFIWK